VSVAPGDTLQDRYRVESLLGAGGMGAVFRGYDTRLDVAVAIKEMTVQPGLPQALHDRLGEQFRQEAKVLARLRHPNLVRVSDVFTERDHAYLVMDFVAGESLADRITREGALPEAQVLVWAEALLAALDYCHAQGIIHRDVKPHNIIITAEGHPILVDFGLVKLWDPSNPATQTAVRGMGTLEYAPPEQYSMRGGHTDPRSDIYSLGSTLYHALTGQAPPTATDRMADPAHFVPVRKLNPVVTPATESAILRAMELARDARYLSAAAMLTALKGGMGSEECAAAQGKPPRGTVPMPDVWELPAGPVPLEEVEALALPTERPVPAPEAAEAAPAASVAGEDALRRSRPRRRSWIWAVAAAALLIVAGVLYGLGYTGKLTSPAAQPAPTQAPARMPTQTRQAPQPTPLPTPLSAARAEEEPPEARPLPHIIVGTSPDFPPMAFSDDRRNLIGFDIDLMHLIGEHGGFEVEFRPAPREHLLLGLEAGEFDAVIAAITINPERSERFAFSEPYLNAGPVVTVREGSDVLAPADLRGRTVGIPEDAAAEAAAMRIGELELLFYDDLDRAFEELAVGRLDAVICGLPIAARYVKRPAEEAPRLRIVGEPLQEELYGIPVRHDRLELLERISRGLHRVRELGLERELVESWLR
jgi:ABC-type amino acid transport substrate-binding protein